VVAVVVGCREQGVVPYTGHYSQACLVLPTLFVTTAKSRHRSLCRFFTKSHACPCSTSLCPLCWFLPTPHHGAKSEAPAPSCLVC
jgi:hypothetical protein